ncbi:probable low-specificity L-threonine aldolase 2 isoform X1 [Vespa crabro]|uniref:probable low-specificity L-threonine aldolase 2 isoform X1 n=2 Tax=Vespa crabro TaxID=7445 RepID=UPI001EFFD797|nr:probable low-specificity L-threonine aldolase 2 isoform X1 [Vespa crabro]
MSDISKGYWSFKTSDLEKKYIVVDLRSDTLTKPTKAMRVAMFNAEVGDDVYEEDPTVKKLEEKAATLMGKEAALFVTSGTMGNLIAIMTHCDVRGSEAYCGEDSHTVLHEQGGAAQLGGVTLCPLPNNPDGSFDLVLLRNKLRKDRLHEPTSKLVIVENTINGKIVPQDWIIKLSELAKSCNLKLHLDGARIWNVVTASNVSAKDLVSVFDSVTFCLSKGLGAPIGSILCGDKSFIRKARRIRKVLGGGMRQVGIIAAAGLVALEEIVPLLKEDHKRAALIARAINNLNSEIFTVDEKTVQTNIVFINIHSKFITSINFAERLQQVQEDEEDDKIIIKCLPLTSTMVRFVLYHEITDEMVEAVIRKITYIIKCMDVNKSST